MLIKIRTLFSKKFVKDSGVTIISNFLVGISGLFVNTIIGNHYGAANLGVINQALSVYMILALLANFGVQTSVQKYTAQYTADKDKLKVVFTNAIISTVISSIFVIIIFLFIIHLFPKILSSENLWNVVKILLYGVPLMAMNKTLNNFMTGLRKMKIYSFVRIARWIVIITLIFIANLMQKSIDYLCYSFIISEAFILIFFIFKTGTFIGPIRFMWLYEHLVFGSKSILSEFVATMNTRMPILVIGYFMGDEAAGFYSYIEIFAFSILMISAAISQNFNPVFTRLWYESNFEEIAKKTREIFKMTALMLLPALVGIILLYYVYTTLMMPTDYLEYLPVLLCLLIGVSFRFLFGSFFTFLIFTNNLYANLLRCIIYAVMNIVLTIVFVYSFGLIGVPVAYFIGVTIDILVIHFMYIKILDLNLLTILSLKNLWKD